MARLNYFDYCLKSISEDISCTDENALEASLTINQDDFPRRVRAGVPGCVCLRWRQADPQESVWGCVPGSTDGCHGA